MAASFIAPATRAAAKDPNYTRFVGGMAAGVSGVLVGCVYGYAVNYLIHQFMDYTDLRCVAGGCALNTVFCIGGGLALASTSMLGLITGISATVAVGLASFGIAAAVIGFCCAAAAIYVCVRKRRMIRERDEQHKLKLDKEKRKIADDMVKFVFSPRMRNTAAISYSMNIDQDDSQTVMEYLNDETNVRTILGDNSESYDPRGMVERMLQDEVLDARILSPIARSRVGIAQAVSISHPFFDEPMDLSDSLSHPSFDEPMDLSD